MSTTSELVLTAALTGGLGGTVYALFKSFDLWRKGTSGRQQSLMARFEREIQRAYHDRDQHERRFEAAYLHIRNEERAHRHCGVETALFEPPRWEPFKGQTEQESQPAEAPDDS